MFLRGKGCDLPQGTDLEFSLGVGEMSLRSVDSELGSALGSWQPPGEAWTGVASVTVTVQHTGSAWSDPGVSPAGRAGTWEWKDNDEILLVRKHFLNQWVWDPVALGS